MLPNPRGLYGVHSVTPYSRLDGTMYGILKVVSSASLNFSGKTVPLNGGSAKGPWAVEEGEIDCSLSLKVSEYPDFLFTLFQGVTPTENAGEALGSVTALTNKLGTSVMNATTGIASVGIITGSEADVKFAKYLVVATTTTTVNLFASTDADFQRGAVENYQDGTLKLLATNVTITATEPSNLVGFGLVLTGGSGTIGMVAGDTASFSARPKNTSSMTGVLGQSGATFPEFGAIVMAKKRGTGELLEIDCYRCKGEGFPIGMDANKWSEATIKIQLMYDAVLNGYAGFRTVMPVSPN